MINTIPSYVTSQDDMGLYVAFEAERSFNEMMEQFAFGELHSIEESGVLLETKKESLKEKFFSWLNSVWEAIKGLYEKVLEFVQKQINKVREHLSKVSAKSSADLKKKAELLKDKTKDGKKKSFGKVHEWGGYKDAVGCSGPVWKAVEEYRYAYQQVPAIETAKGKIVSSGDNITAMKSAQREKIKSIYGSIEGKVKADLKVGNLNSDTIQKKVKAIIAGKEFDADKQYILSNWEDLYAGATDFGRTASSLKKSLNVVKANFDSTRKELESYMKKVGDDEDSTISTIITYSKKGKIVLTAICNAMLATVKARNTEAANLVLRVAFAGKEKKEATNESAAPEVVPSSFQTELASLFEM